MSNTPYQREDVRALERFNVHRHPTWQVFSGTGLKLVTSQPRSDTLTTRLPRRPNLHTRFLFKINYKVILRQIGTKLLFALSEGERSVRDGPCNFESRSIDEDDIWFCFHLSNFHTVNPGEDKKGVEFLELCRYNMIYGPSGKPSREDSKFLSIRGKIAVYEHEINFSHFCEKL
ncbi:hypothetical protein TNCV_39781 [Trichonephila clavipes]|nr:hypothetical protein TNCV_39781 [Trichonephila clavipes]